MREIVTVAIVFVFAVKLSAQTPIPLSGLGTRPPVHNSGIPIVEENGDDVTIKCDSTLYDVDVIIRDQFGNVIHRSTQTIGPDETAIYVPSSDGDSEKATIDLYYDRKHLSGYFNE